MYDLLISKAADLWAGSDPSEVRLYVNGQSNEYLRGQVELIRELGLLPPDLTMDDQDADASRVLIARDIRRQVEANDRPTLTFTRV